MHNFIFNLLEILTKSKPILISLSYMGAKGNRTLLKYQYQMYHRKDAHTADQPVGIRGYKAIGGMLPKKEMDHCV